MESTLPEAPIRRLCPGQSAWSQSSLVVARQKIKMGFWKYLRKINHSVTEPWFKYEEQVMWRSSVTRCIDLAAHYINWCNWPDAEQIRWKWITMNLADLPGFLVYSCGPKSLRKRHRMSILWDLYIKPWEPYVWWGGKEMKPTVDFSLLHHPLTKVLQLIEMNKWAAPVHTLPDSPAVWLGVSCPAPAVAESSPNRPIPPLYRALCEWCFMNADCSTWSTNRWRVGGGTGPETESWI